LEYELDEIDPDALAEWEAGDPEEKGPRPEPTAVTKKVEIPSEARLVFTGIGGYQNLSLGPGGVTAVRVSEEDPSPPEVPPEDAAKSGNGRRKKAEEE